MKHSGKHTLFLAVCLTVLLFCSLPAAAAVTADSTVGTSTEINTYLDQGYKAANAYYSLDSHKTLTSYWSVFGAYARLGEAIQNGNYTYNATESDPSQLGANALAVIMMGDDPYHYKGKNLIQGVAAMGDTGAFSVPVFNFLALQAAGYDLTAAQEEALVNKCCEKLTDLSQGPDIGGWALVALSRYLDDPTYQSRINTALTTYQTEVAKNMAGASMGSAGLSTGCVVTGFTALTAMGVDGYDVTADAPWATMTTPPLKLMWECFKSSEVSSFYDHQYYMEFSDLYKVLYKGSQPCWIACGVTRGQLETLTSEANALLADKARYTRGSIDRLEKALAAVNGLTETALSEEIPTWGASYYALCRAVETCREKGNAALMTDLDASAWYYEKVSGVVAEGLMNGTNAAGTVFEPNAKLTRGMMVQILYNMAGQPAYTGNNPFSDVSSTKWYASAIIWAYENGVAKGTGTASFTPDQSVTREQMAAFICRYAETMGISLTKGNATPFTDDNAISTYAKDSVYTLVNEGIIDGMGNNYFKPAETATRAQVAKIIYGLMSKTDV
ncbi:MAG TPA: S-layer homology domain-containing protein [Clostridiales bacterium]|nr:S-layer homology domain-containing protein [Clostridiales bacterium]